MLRKKKQQVHWQTVTANEKTRHHAEQLNTDRRMHVVKGHGRLTGQDIAHSSKEPVEPVEDRSIGTLRCTSTDG